MRTSPVEGLGLLGTWGFLKRACFGDLRGHREDIGLGFRVRKIPPSMLNRHNPPEEYNCPTHQGTKNPRMNKRPFKRV